MWKSAYVSVYQLLNWKMHSETLKNEIHTSPKEVNEFVFLFGALSSTVSYTDRY